MTQRRPRPLKRHRVALLRQAREERERDAMLAAWREAHPGQCPCSDVTIDDPGPDHVTHIYA